MEIKLKLEARETKLKPNQLRRTGKVPATVYGPGISSVSVQVCQKEFSRLPKTAYSQLVDLEMPEGNVKALIRTVQRKAVNFEILNIEFYRVSNDRKITVIVPLNYHGVSPAVQKGGQLVEIFHTATIECMSNDIPANLDVDISQIENIDQGLHFSDLKTPSGVKILNPLEELVARVVPKKAGK